MRENEHKMNLYFLYLAVSTCFCGCCGLDVHTSPLDVPTGLGPRVTRVFCVTAPGLMEKP